MSIFLWSFSCWTASCMHTATRTLPPTLSVLLLQSNLRFLITMRIFHEWFTCCYFPTQCTLIVSWLHGISSPGRGAQPVSYKSSFGVSNLGPVFGCHLTCYSKADTQKLWQYDIWSFGVNMFVKSWPTRVQDLHNDCAAYYNVDLAMCAFLWIFIEFEQKIIIFLLKAIGIIYNFTAIN